jgi:hypothetical protein
MGGEVDKAVVRVEAALSTLYIPGQSHRGSSTGRDVNFRAYFLNTNDGN